MRLHLFRPAAAGRYPGILLYSEIYQITGPIRRMAAFLAGQGYLVAAPEVYHEFEKPGAVLAYDAAGTRSGQRAQIHEGSLSLR
jgi:carboxymethylenebutenolidase